MIAVHWRDGLLIDDIACLTGLISCAGRPFLRNKANMDGKTAYIGVGVDAILSHQPQRSNKTKARTYLISDGDRKYRKCRALPRSGRFRHAHALLLHLTPTSRSTAAALPSSHIAPRPIPAPLVRCISHAPTSKTNRSCARWVPLPAMSPSSVRCSAPE